MTLTSSTGAWKQDKGCHDAEGGNKVQESARLRGATETSSHRKFLRRLREGSGMAMHVHVALEKELVSMGERAQYDMRAKSISSGNEQTLTVLPSFFFRKLS